MKKIIVFIILSISIFCTEFVYKDKEYMLYPSELPKERTGIKGIQNDMFVLELDEEYQVNFGDIIWLGGEFWLIGKTVNGNIKFISEDDILVYWQIEDLRESLDKFIYKLYRNVDKNKVEEDSIK